MQQLLALRHRPTAVFAVSDKTAFGAMEAIKDAGLRIPEDVSIVGIDDVHESAYSAPPLTTYLVPKRALGEMAVATLGALLADVAHELRPPLSVIQGNTEGIIDGLYPADRPHLEPILEETRVMARLLEDLQTLSTAEAGALRLHRQRVEPRQMLEEAEAVFDPRAQAAGVTLTVRAAAGLPMLDVDPVRIGEVLTNLLTNALRAVPAGGTVTVSADPAQDGRAVAFAVRDTGAGIPPERLPSVFDRFVKSADSGGAGLGLAIAKSLVEAHGGRIDVESAPGRGTTMRFVLPA